jgi:hypothetical protein
MEVLTTEVHRETSCALQITRRHVDAKLALVDRSPRPAAEAALEVFLATGERLRISAGVDAATLRTWWTCCEHDPLAGQRAVYLCLTPCDMCKSFYSLHALVRDHLELDVLAGHLFVFTSRRRDRVKILYWDRDGLAVWSKRLEEGTYAVPQMQTGAYPKRSNQEAVLGKSPPHFLPVALYGFPVSCRDRTYSCD